MSITVNTGVGSLISVGLAVTDVANLYALGRRVGNWATAPAGDVEFLDLLQSDEFDILRRRGMVDPTRFNARWGDRARLLMNGRPTTLVGDDAAKVLGTLSRFTASMVAIVAALDEFMNYIVLKEVMKRLLKMLLRTTEYGEDVLSSQLNDRVNAWRSTAYLRGLSVAVQSHRQDLIAARKVLDGYMPAGEAQVMADFLYWLLSGDTDTLTTPSSDVAGVAKVLSKIGFDILCVEGWGENARDTPCKVVYTPALVSVKARVTKSFNPKSPNMWFEDTANFWREQSTTVSLTQPEESMSTFPISQAASNETRRAWSVGRRVAASARWQVNTTAATVESEDVVYEPIDLGTPIGRIRKEVFALAKHHGFCVNAEYCEGLSSVFEQMDESTLVWLHDQSSRKEVAYREHKHIESPEMQDKNKIEAFTFYQAFMLGYYYAVFLPFVDTSALAIQTVSGAWGYRSAEALDVIREHVILKKELTREGMQIVLAALCFSQVKSIPDLGKDNRCLGIIGKRALLVNSLVTDSDSPQAVGRFTILDVAVGHIPSDADGLVRPGQASLFFEEYKVVDPSVETVIPAVPDKDFTKHIEPDWDGNPETVLLVMRYEGRRVATLNPAYSDIDICHSYIAPVEKPHDKQEIPNGINFTIENFLSRKCLHTRSDGDTRIVVQSKGRPGIRYTAASGYGLAPWKLKKKPGIRSHIGLVSNCVVAATIDDVQVIVT